MRSFLSAAFPSQYEPGACMLVARRGEVLLQECRGTAEIKDGRAITPDTTFRLASIAKQFTATVILLLREQKSLQLKQLLPELLPELKGTPAQHVTVKHLLQHTAGLIDYEDDLPADLEKPLSDEDVLQITARHTKTWFPAGTQFRYSNTGYALLACIAQRIISKPYSLILENMIFKPLGMTNTVARHDTIKPDVPNRAYGYRRMPDGSYVDCDQNNTSAVLGDGGIYCSANDYLKWDRAYWFGEVLPLPVVKEMTTRGMLMKKGTATETDRIWFPADMNEPPPHVGQGESSTAGEACYYAGGNLAAATCEIPYGMGWRLEQNDDGLEVAYHPGSSTGFMHCVRHVVEKDLTVLVLANRTVAPSKELARDIESRMLRQLRND